MKILLISGHGANDPGASGNGHKEADLTRELVNLIAPKLREYATVDVYNQSRNAYADCTNGTFNIGTYDYVLEVHFNAFNGKAYGTEIYVTSRETATTVEEKIMDKMGKFFTVRGVKVTDFLVINTVKSKGISSALIETCFIDNATDMKVYEGSKKQIAEAIVNGIAEGFGLKKDSGESAEKPAEKPSKPASGKIVEGSTVRPIKAVSYDGVKLISDVTKNNYPVIELKGKRAVLGNGLNTAFNVDNLKLVSGGSTSSGNTSKPKTLKEGMKATPKKAVSYDGVKLISDVTKNKYTVIEIKEKRVVLGDGLNTAFNIDNLKY